MDGGLIGLLGAAIPLAGAGVAGVWFWMRHTTQQQITAASTYADGLVAEAKAHFDSRIADLKDTHKRELDRMQDRHDYEVQTLRTDLAESRQEVRQLNQIVVKAAASLEKNAASQDALVNLMHAVIPKATGTD